MVTSKQIKALKPVRLIRRTWYFTKSKELLELSHMPVHECMHDGSVYRFRVRDFINKTDTYFTHFYSAYQDYANS